MKTSHHFLLFLVCWHVLLIIICYFTHVAAIGDTGTSFGGIKCIDLEREALLRFKGGIKVDNCGLLSSWGVHENCCLWGGIRCSNRTGHVIMVDLQGVYGGDPACLEGKLDPSLFDLKHLKYLDLSQNNFNQTIPKSIDSLTNLEHLNLSYAGLFGEIPPQLGNLSKLSFLDLGHNGLPLDFKTILRAKSLQCVSRLTLLREIDLSFCNLSEATDWFQTINKLPSLSVLHLDLCYLPSKLIPSSISYINSSSALRFVSLSGNSLNDTSILQWLFNMSRNGNHLEYLDLHYNSFSGPLPSEFGNMHSLSYLDLSANQFEGPIPTTFLSPNKSLRALFLSFNELNGSLLEILAGGNLCNLQTLNLAGNNFAHDMSTVFQALSTGCANKPLLLESLDLSWNHFWGSIPDIITSFSSLRELYLGSNNLNGTITHNHFSNLSRLSVLDLANNSALAFDINDGWIPPFQLRMLDLESCNLGPSFPKWLLTQTKIHALNISNAQISDTIPAEFWTNSISNIEILNVSRNKIHGVLPDLLTNLHNVSVIDLSSNKFEGSIPSFFVENNSLSILYLNDNMFSDATHVLCPKTKTNLIYLNLSNNLLSGKVPDCWMKFEGLISLHLENNYFFGSMPTSIGALRYLRFLHLENNNFSGELPASLLNCTFLEIVVIKNNSLTGNIPSTIGIAFTNLGILNLRGNKFYGRLPLTLCQMSNLKILDLANNRLSKTIPNCIYNLRAMMTQSKPASYAGKFYNDDGWYQPYQNEETVEIMWKREENIFTEYSMALVKLIDLSHNELEGKIPEGISNLTELRSLDLSRNKLSGVIPSNIGQLTSLESLDLSNNHLSGEIPTSLAQINFLAALNVSNNDLSGKIPHGTQLQGFDYSAFEGNMLLCGAPLRDCQGDEAPTTTINNGDKQDKHGGYDEFYLGLCISVVLGFMIGFWGVCGTLVVKRSWRHAFFRFYDDMKDTIYIMVVVRVARAWRKP